MESFGTRVFLSIDAKYIYIYILLLFTIKYFFSQVGRFYIARTRIIIKLKFKLFEKKRKKERKNLMQRIIKRIETKRAGETLLI